MTREPYAALSQENEALKIELAAVKRDFAEWKDAARIGARSEYESDDVTFMLANQFSMNELLKTRSRGGWIMAHVVHDPSCTRTIIFWTRLITDVGKKS